MIDVLQIRSQLSPECFKIDTMRSLRYMVQDIVIFGCLIAAFYLLVSSQLFENANLLWKLPIVFCFSLVTGFFMWCIFVIGHDCGHRTFSKNNKINRVAGEICHSVILLTPFYAWRLSHLYHHRFHNHRKKDYSFPRVPDQSYVSLKKYPAVYFFYKTRFVIPFYSWFSYLYLGLSDGGHLFQFGRLWKQVSAKQKRKALTSSFITLLALVGWILLLGWKFLLVYMLSWAVFGFFLFTVTYLQHHHEQAKIYEDEQWDFTLAAFETIDRKYGWGLDDIHHNISDCHVIHHLFYSLIPHYNLKRATQELKSILKAEGLLHLYNHKKTPYFFVDVFKDVTKYWFFVDHTKTVDPLA